jgi:Flp pilus assembly protein TadD
MVADVQRTDENKHESAENNYMQAIALAEKEFPPDRLQMALAYQGLASIYAGHSDFDRALTMLDNARIANPEGSQVDGEEGLILVQAGRWTDAEALLQKAMAVSPNNENVLNALGLISWQQRHNLNEATTYFMRALAVHAAADDFSASLHNNLAAIYGEENRLSDAIAQLKVAVSIAPNDPEYHTNLAQAYVYAGENELARKELQTALSLAPNYQPARLALERLSNR